MFKNDEVCDLVQIDLSRVRKIRAALVQPDAVQGLADTFSALGDPTRVRILDALSHGELCVCDLAAVLRLSQSAVSHQLRLLRGLRLVRPRRDGRVVFYSLDDQHIISLFRQTLQHVEEQAAPAARPRRRESGVAMTSLRDAAGRRLTPQADHLGCAHCEVEAPAPTGARIRGWFTAAAAALVAAACASAGSRRFPDWSAPIFIAAAIVGSVFPAQRAWQSITRGSLDINVLMVVAVVGALAIRQFEEAAMVVSLFAAAQWLEAQSLDRARKAIGRLLDLAATDRAGAGCEAASGQIDIEQVAPGALMIVKPGEKFALDGIVRQGRSDVNQAPITGESLPVEKVEGDEVFAGTINGHGALTVAVTRRRADTTLARIVHLVESAQAKRAPLQQFIDRFAAWYTPSIVILAVVVATVPSLLFGQPFETWLYRALVLLVVSCPCALVISTPVSIVSALAGAARQGVLVKGGIHLERLAGVRVVAFDKTGTVTTGRLTLDAVHPVDGYSADRSARARGVGRIAVRTSDRRRHHVGRARSERVAFRRTAATCGRCRDWASKDASGRPPSCAARRGCSPIAACMTPAIAGTGRTASSRRHVADRGRPGRRADRRARRDGSAEGRRRPGGLRPARAGRVARRDDHRRSRGRRAAPPAPQLGVDDVRSGQLPEDKVTAVENLRHAHGAVAMVGDGVNDAPALAAADVGIVMGAMGSDAALETADIALMTDELPKVPYTIRLSRATLANIRVNVAMSIGLKAAFVVLAVAGVATLWMAVLADTGASALVVANAVRLRRFV